MGGFLQKSEIKKANLDDIRLNKVNVNQKYFRPSCLSALNSRIFPFAFFDPYYEKDVSEIHLPQNLMTSPKNAILNYFSVLREAAIFTEGKTGGCGTVGMATIPYPVAYQFLTEDYQKRVTYHDFLHSFQNIGHINLIKLKRVNSVSNSQNSWRFFVEVETIEGAGKDVTYFAYYYGFITVKQENNRFKIDDMVFNGEDFLCAAYHGWSHDAEAVVDIKYGEWCKLVRRRHPTYKQGYIKYIYFYGTDGHNYLFVFFELTNGTDIEIAQYKQGISGEWVLIKINPNKCIERNNLSSEK
ncbi:hypothetical protein A9C19_05070 [Bacillus weihaiensis]|uniref:Uncharacterized protein n=2 Tax=Bacillus weihaiensis TaxID=1547283 RepID=A0A1L3MXA3_9BACI|nr:hypothetical protein A9C19_05070 [Bacillus weihaiensis]